MTVRGMLPPGTRRFLLTTRAGRVALILPRLLMAVRKSGALPRLYRAVLWAFCSRDIAARSYHTSRLNQDELCWTVSMIAGCPVETVMAYRDEVLGDSFLADHVHRAVLASPQVWSHDRDYRLGRRLAFYLLVRALKPRRVLEAGVDRGYGAILILRALEHNHAEGHAGEYIGFDSKGEDDAFLYTSYPNRQGRIERGDASALLKSSPTLPRTLLIHDVCAEPGHISDFIHAIEDLVMSDTVFVSSWSLPAFADFALRRGFRLTTHKDSAPTHWASPSRLTLLFGGARMDPGEKG